MVMIAGGDGCDSLENKVHHAAHSETMTVCMQIRVNYTKIFLYLKEQLASNQSARKEDVWQLKTTQKPNKLSVKCLVLQKMKDV